MTPAEIEAAFVAAGRARSLVWLAEPAGRYRVVEPYLLFCSSTGKRLLHCFQVGGYSSGGMPRGWKNAQPSAFDDARIVDRRFTPREEYNPFNREIFPTVVFAIPTRGGEQRLPDAGEACGPAGGDGAGE